MLFPVIRVKEKGQKGKGRILGTNTHDLLTLDENGNIKYVNLQCLEGTGEDGCYEFVTEKGYDNEPQIEFVSFEKLVEIYKQETEELCKDEAEIIESAKSFRRDAIKGHGLDKDEGVGNSAGNLI